MRHKLTFAFAFVLTIALHGYAQTQLAASQPTHTIKIDFNQRVRMRDGVELSADVYRPDSAGQFPVILSRTPYNKNGGSTLAIARYFVPRGYVFVAMDVRGRGDSDGEFVPYRNDGRDGYDAIEWCAKQSWSTGKIGTIGGSYNGRIQWLTALEQPPHLATMIAIVTPSDPFVEWPTGLPIPMGISWYHFTGNRWVDENEWPIARTQWVKYYLHSRGRANSLFGDGSLSTNLPDNQPFDSYVNDPARPVPFITEPSFAQIGSTDDYRSVERRDDVLVYTTAALTEEVQVLWSNNGAIACCVVGARYGFHDEVVGRMAQRLCTAADGWNGAREISLGYGTSFVDRGRACVRVFDRSVGHVSNVQAGPLDSGGSRVNGVSEV